MTQWYRAPHGCMTYDVAFNTPAFLGDAEQNAAWRTPPFKALLRQWWRVRMASSCSFDPARLLRQEHELFGGVHGDAGQRSAVMVRLDDWSQPADIKRGEKIDFGIVAEPTGKNSGPAAVYLGYGPVEQRSSNAKRSALLKSSAKLSVVVPTEHSALLGEVMQLAGWFGTLGSRARNGWGSLHIVGDGIQPLGSPESQALLATVQRSFDECMSIDWPHALGADQRGALLWRTRDSFADWKGAMLALAKLRRHLRGQFGWQGVGGIGERHILAYPATSHVVGAWDRQSGRAPNQLRLKVVRGEDGKLFGMAAHFPHKLHLAADLELQKRVWRDAHDFLDQNVQPFPGYRD